MGFREWEWGHLGIPQVEKFFVAYGVQSVEVAEREEPLCLLFQAILHHGSYTLVDAFSEFVASPFNENRLDFERTFGSWLLYNLAVWLACCETHF